MSENNFQAIPQELRNAPRWLLWNLEQRNGKDTKVPYNIKGGAASTTDPSTWVPFEKAWEVYNDAWGDYRGIGCVIAPPFIGIDLDKCRNPETGEVEDWALEAIKELDSYTELSPSGKGFHIWVKGSMPPGGSRTGRVEIYARARYFTMTGLHYEGTPTTINDRDLTAFHAKHIREKSTSQTPETKDTSQSAKEFRIACDVWKRLGVDASIDDAILEFMAAAPSREKWEKHRDYIDRTLKAAKAKVFPDAADKAIHTELIVERFSNIQSKSMSWLWPNRVPKGKLVIFSGNPDGGKTTILCDIIGRYTTGRQFPDGELCVDTGEVLFLSSEDDAEDTLKPRLEAAGADVDRVHYVKGVKVNQGAKSLERALALDTDLSAIEAELTKNRRVGIVAIDPMTSYLGKMDMNKEQKLREVLNPIKELAEKTGVTFIGLGHFNKRSDVAAIHRVGGAVAMSGVARAVWLFMKNPERDGEHLMLLGKGNLTKQRDGLRYAIITRNTETGEAPAIDWRGIATKSAEDISELNANPEERACVKAEAFLKSYLTEDRTAEDVTRAAEAAGIHTRTLNKVKKSLGIESQKQGNQWYWSRLQGCNTLAEGCNVE